MAVPSTALPRARGQRRSRSLPSTLAEKLSSHIGLESWKVSEQIELAFGCTMHCTAAKDGAGGFNI